jgi:DNA-binding XRE family transcriptional regulator
MSDIAPLATFIVDGKECVVLSRTQFDRLMEALDDRLDSRAAERALSELEGREGDVLTTQEVREAAKAPLRFWRKRRGLTQAELAKAADVAQPYLSGIELGAKEGSLGVMKRLAKVLDVRLDDLVAG